MANLEHLKNPGALMRSAPFWSWNEKLDESELRRQIREMAAKGWGSYFMHSRVGLVTGYLSDEWMSLVRACADEAQKTGTYAWLYDEDKWPSGFAGGLVPEKDEAYRSRAIVLLAKGKATDEDTVIYSYKYDGLEYDICKRVCALRYPWFNGTSFVDLMNPEAVKYFIECTHEAYKKACGEYFGKSIPGIFTDEPGYLMSNQYESPAVPWSDYLPDFFTKSKSYDITKKLHMLFFDIEDYKKVRFDFYDSATELFKQSFTKQYYDWCEQNNLIMTGHFMSEDSLRYQTTWSGDVMSHYEFMHWPGIDKLGRYLKPPISDFDQIVTVKQVSSVVEQLNKDRAFSEVYGCIGGQSSFFHRKWIGDWQAALGINFVNHHLSLYSMRGARKRDYPANFFYQQPWWSDEKGFADYQGRLNASLSEGKRIVDILVLQPMTSVWSEYSPMHEESEYSAEKTFDIPFAKISHRLIEKNLDFHYGNENLMAKYASVDGINLTIGQHSYKCVIVPPSDNIKSSTLKAITEFATNGGQLIFTSSLPHYVDGVKKDISIPGAIVAMSIIDVVKIADESFPNRIKTTDILSGKNASEVYVHARDLGHSVRILFANVSDTREVHLNIDLAEYAKSGLAVFDLFDGEIYKLSANNGNFDVTLATAGSLLILTGEEAKLADKELTMIIGSGANFNDCKIKQIPALSLDSFDCKLLEENVMLLNDYELEMNGKKVYEGPVCGAWHTHFYPDADGTPFKATYTFNSDCEVDNCFSAIEVAENLDSITFNGSPVKAMKSRGELGAFNPDKSWKDINFTKVHLPGIKKGANTLIIEGQKVNNITGPGWHNRVPDWQNHQATEAEEVYICGSFALKLISDGKYIITKYNKPAGKNLTNEGYPFYCGRVVLSSEFELKTEPGKRYYIQINNAEFACAEVRINGKSCSTLRWKPFIVEITNEINSGINKLEIEIAPTLVNAFGPNRIAGIKENKYIGPFTFVDMAQLKQSYELFNFGVEEVAIFSV